MPPLRSGGNREEAGTVAVQELVAAWNVLLVLKSSKASTPIWMPGGKRGWKQ
jgi:hypothetical protein